MANLDSILKSRDITLPTKVPLVKAMVFPMVITFLPRSKCLLISWLQLPSVVILEPRKIKSDTVSTVSPSISHEVMGPDAMTFVFWENKILCMTEIRPTLKTTLFQHFMCPTDYIKI